MRQFNPGGAFLLYGSAIVSLCQLIRQCQPVRSLFIHMEFRGHSGSAESADEQQGIFHRYRLIRKGMPDEGLRHFICYLFLQGQLLSQLLLSAA